MLRAMYKVQKNHGSAGVDHMPVTKLSELMSIDKDVLTEKVRSGRYLSQAILGVEIPKGNGAVRLLGIPTVTDRLLQQAVLQVINARFEYEFSGSSFGFRPNKNAGQAAMKAQGYINDGFQYIVDIDLKTFFDEVDHCYLLQLLYRKIKCHETLRLIRKWLRSPIQINGKLVKRRKGVPQGSPLSPLLSNIMLNELDRELERQGLRFVRFADDFSIYLKTKASARKVGNNIYKFLKKKLKLSINREKSGIRRPVQFTCLGFGFVPTYVKGEKGKYQLVVSDKSWKSLKQKLKTITRKTTPMSFDELMGYFFKGTDFPGQVFYVAAEKNETFADHLFELQKNDVFRDIPATVKVVFASQRAKEDFLSPWLDRFKLVDAAGGMVQNEKGEYLCIFNRNKWTLPKGRVEWLEPVFVGDVVDVDACRLPRRPRSRSCPVPGP